MGLDPGAGGETVARVAIQRQVFLSGPLEHLPSCGPGGRSSKYYSTPAAGRGRKPCICGKIPRSKRLSDIKI